MLLVVVGNGRGRGSWQCWRWSAMVLVVMAEMEAVGNGVVMVAVVEIVGNVGSGGCQWWWWPQRLRQGRGRVGHDSVVGAKKRLIQSDVITRPSISRCRRTSDNERQPIRVTARAIMSV